MYHFTWVSEVFNFLVLIEELKYANKLLLKISQPVGLLPRFEELNFEPPNTKLFCSGREENSNSDLRTTSPTP